MFIVVSYDVAGSKARRRVASELENFGVRIQYSIFECHLDDKRLEDLEGRLSELIDWETDRVAYYRLCADDAGQILTDGPGAVAADSDYHII